MEKIITIKDGKVVPDINVLSIPELKVLYEKFEEDEETRNLLFLYLHHTYEPSSPYSNKNEDEREELVRKDFRGNYKPNFDKDILKAREKMKDLTWSPVKDLLEGIKINMKKIATLLKTEDITTGKDGNLSQFTTLHKSAQDLIKNYYSTEKTVAAENAKNKGNAKTAIDEGEDY